MASPDVFLSSPPRASKRRCYTSISSSPDLPSPREILSQKPPRAPIKSGSKAQPIPVDAERGFVSAIGLLHAAREEEARAESEQLRQPATPPRKKNEKQARKVNDVDIEEVEEIHGTPKRTAKASKPKKRPERSNVTNLSDPSLGEEPWKKYRSSPQAKKQVDRLDPLEKPPEVEDVEILPELPPMKVKSPSRISPYFQTGNAVELRTAPNAGSDLGELRISRVEKAPKAKSAPKAKKHEKASESDHELHVETTGDDKHTAISKPHKPRKEVIVEEPLHLEQAPSRRLDWTPPKRFEPTVEQPAASLTQGVEAPESDEEDGFFETLRQNYICTDTKDQNDSVVEIDPHFLKNRKLIEGIATSSKPALESETGAGSSKKVKARKKPRTITGLAIAAYKPASQPVHERPSSSMHNHFKPDAHHVGATSTSARNMANGQKAKRPSRKKKEPPKPVLLSPGSALAQVSKQDFVFGTSSQLAAEQSPSLLREIQAAIKRSKEPDFDDFPATLNSDGVEPMGPSTKLWDAAARDGDGDLFHVEVVDLASKPNMSQSPEMQPNPFGYLKEDVSKTDVPDSVPADIQHDEDSFMNISDVVGLSGSSPPCAVKAKEEVSAKSTVNASTNMRDISPSPVQETSSIPARPTYELFTDSQLSRQIQSYGFKAVKRRTAMIALLDQCWRSKNGVNQTSLTGTSPTRNASTAVPPHPAADCELQPAPKKRGRPPKTQADPSAIEEPPPSGQAAEPPKRRRGRPRKASPNPSRRSKQSEKSSEPVPPRGKSKSKKTKPAARGTAPSKGKGAAKKAILEIPDSELESDNASILSASPASSPEPTFSPSQDMDLSMSISEDTELSLAVSPLDQESAIFDYIQNAIVTAPRTTDPMQPSWHEKILIYDPIILEDLTAWLNAGELTRVGYDGEVNPGDVKQWCESKSICCLWRVNLRGKERKRY